MGYWKRTTLVKKRYETTVGHNATINLRNFTDNVAWEDERVLLNWNNFNLGGKIGTNTINYYGLAMAVANPIGNNVYNTQVGVVRVNINTKTQGTNHGLIVNSGIQFNSNAKYTVFSGTHYAFFFMVAFSNKWNGLINGSGFEVYRRNIIRGNRSVTTWSYTPLLSGEVVVSYENSNTNPIYYNFKYFYSNWEVKSGILTIYANESFGVNY